MNKQDFLDDLFNRWQRNQVRFDDAIEEAIQFGVNSKPSDLVTEPAFTDASKTLPVPQSIKILCAPYHIVKTENFGEQRAMYLFDENGENGWYLSYISKLIVPVLAWRKESV